MEEDISEVVLSYCPADEKEEASVALSAVVYIYLIFLRKSLLPLVSNGLEVSNISHGYHPPLDCYKQFRSVCKNLKMVSVKVLFTELRWPIAY